MTDKEKIELIIQDKHLNNTEFCNVVNISPGTLSHIRSGRTEPTLNILRNIVQAFPDINPAWVFYGEEPMYKNVTSPTPEHDVADNTFFTHAADADSIDNDELSLFAPLGNFAHPSTAQSTAQLNPATTASVHGGSAARRGGTPITSPAPVNVQEIVAETLKQQQKPQRKIVEVRIFFDDGTFETFSSK